MYNVSSLSLSVLYVSIFIQDHCKDILVISKCVHNFASVFDGHPGLS